MDNKYVLRHDGFISTALTITMQCISTAHSLLLSCSYKEMRFCVDIEKLSGTLKLLATGDTHRSEAARLRDVFDHIESAMQAGVSRSAILSALHEQGFHMTLKSFESAIYRLRKMKRMPAEKHNKAVVRIAGFDVVSTNRFTHNQIPENDLLK